MCGSVPQRYTGNGTFVLSTAQFDNRHAATLDGLGRWGVPQGSARYYALKDQQPPVRVTQADNADIKVTRKGLSEAANKYHEWHCFRFFAIGTVILASTMPKVAAFTAKYTPLLSYRHCTAMYHCNWW